MMPELKHAETEIDMFDMIFGEKSEFKKAKKVDPRKYTKFTTEPSKERLSKQFVHGLKPVTNKTNVEGYNKTHGNKRFNLNTLKWKNVKN
jgi:hypothetical protein